MCHQETGYRREQQDKKRVRQRHDHRDLHLPRLHLPPQELGCTPHHQTTDKHGNNDKHVIIHESHTDTAEPAINHHIQHREHPRHRCQAIVHAIYRTVGSNRGRLAPQRGPGRTDAYLLPFHAPQLLTNTHPGDLVASPHLEIMRPDHAYQIGEQHHAENGKGQFLPLQIKSQGKHHRHRDNQDRPALHHVREESRVL